MFRLALLLVSGFCLLADSPTEIPVDQLINVGSDNCFYRRIPEKEFGTYSACQDVGWVRTPREYSNFRMTFEIRAEQWAEAMLVLRANEIGSPTQTGIAIPFSHDFHGKTSRYVTGAVAGRAEPTMFLPPIWGVWRKVEVELIGQRLIVRVDGSDVQRVNIQDADGASWAEPKGFIGFVNLHHRYQVRYLAISPVGESGVLDLPIEEKMLERTAGWLQTGDRRWSVTRKTLVGDAGNGIVYAPGEFSDFEFYATFKTEGRMNSGVFLRGEPSLDIDQKKRGFEVQIYSPPDAVFPSGSIYGQVRSNLDLDLEEQWARLRIRVVAGTVRVWINGRPTASGKVPQLAPAKGRIGLQIHAPSGTVQFRDLRILEIKPETK